MNKPKYKQRTTANIIVQLMTVIFLILAIIFQCKSCKIRKETIEILNNIK